MSRRPDATLSCALSALALSFLAGAPASAHEGCASLQGNTPLEQAIRNVAARDPNPDHAKARILSAVRRSAMCFPDNVSPEDLEQIITDWNLLPPGLYGQNWWEFINERFNVDGTTWVGPNGAQGPSGRAVRATMTYSFPNDGVTWGLPAVSSTGPNTLNASLTATFGANDLDEGREYIRHGLAAFEKWAGITYSEVADLNVPMNQTITPPGNGGGDYRIGGRAFGTGSFLAYNAFPSAAFAGVGGGDMCWNTSFFLAANFNNPTNNYRYLRNTSSHEHGHGNGFIHQVPCNSTKNMEPSIHTTTVDTLAIDDRRAAARNFGDRFSGNNAPANAVNFGNLTTPIPTSIIERGLATNGTAGFNNSDEDWFRFTIGATSSMTISVAPIGGTYNTAQQTSGCTGSGVAVNAGAAGNLNIELLASDGTTVLQTAAAAAAGSTETLTANNLAAGTYFVRVVDVGPNVAANQIVQLYDLTIRNGASTTAPPWAVAGINKRGPANANIFYFGDILSQANEPGATITTYDWDLDGDGSFEVTNVAKPSRQYPSNGVYNVTLRITDSNGRLDTDTITMTVFGATTTVTNATPNAGIQGAAIPVTITGTNLKNLTAASMVTVSGTGVTVTGTPVPNALGTSVTGLVFNIAAGATVGGRDITVTNADGTGTGVALFTINAGASPCPGDANGDRVINFTDLNLVLSNFGSSGAGIPGDVNGDGIVNFTDLNLVLSNFGVVCP